MPHEDVSALPLVSRGSTRAIANTVVAALCWFAIRYLQVRLLGWGSGGDPHLYLDYARDWGGGGAPYATFHPEYPPGALPVFMAPYLVAGGDRYFRSFGIEMALFDLAAFGLVLAWTRRLYAQGWRAPVLTGLAYLAFSTALFPVLYSRFDLVPGALVCAALYCSYAVSPVWLGPALLGIAGGVKLWPLALTPLFVLLALRRRGWRGAVGASAWIGLGGLVTVLPFVPRAGSRVLGFLQYHAQRGIQIESTWSSLALSLDALGLASAGLTHDYGAFHATGRFADLLAKISIPALLLLALGPQLAALRGRLGREGDEQGQIGLCVATGTVLGFMAGGKVLSPQYMLWLVPLLPLVCATGMGFAQRAALALAALTIAGLTSLIYPYWSPALERQVEGHHRALLALSTRNLLLFALYGYALWRSLQKPATT